MYEIFFWQGDEGHLGSKVQVFYSLAFQKIRPKSINFPITYPTFPVFHYERISLCIFFRFIFVLWYPPEMKMRNSQNENRSRYVKKNWKKKRKAQSLRQPTEKEKREKNIEWKWKKIHVKKFLVNYTTSVEETTTKNELFSVFLFSFIHISLVVSFHYFFLLLLILGCMLFFSWWKINVLRRWMERKNWLNINFCVWKGLRTFDQNQMHEIWNFSYLFCGFL